jgi:hypothetical protein
MIQKRTRTGSVCLGRKVQTVQSAVSFGAGGIVMLSTVLRSK